MKTALVISLLAPLAAVAAPAPELASRQSTTSLDALMKSKGKLYFGTCADQGRLSSGKTADVIKADFGQVTPENSMKWDQTEATRGQFNTAQGQYLVDWATENNKTIRGHTLVWHSQLAGWVSNIRDKDTLTSVIQNHVTTLVTKWKGKIRAWVGRTTARCRGCTEADICMRTVGCRQRDV
jgi:endo-1,4-beta-xylanase